MIRGTYLKGVVFPKSWPDMVVFCNRAFACNNNINIAGFFFLYTKLIPTRSTVGTGNYLIFLSWRTMLCIFTVICCDSQWPMLYIHCYLSTPQALGSTLSLHSIPTLCPKEKQLSVACHQSFKRTIKFLYSLHTTHTVFLSDNITLC